MKWIGDEDVRLFINLVIDKFVWKLNESNSVVECWTLHTERWTTKSKWIGRVKKISSHLNRLKENVISLMISDEFEIILSCFRS